MKTSSDPPAELLYGPAHFKVLRPGAYVLCAITGERIALTDLRYWSVTRQEAYASPEASLEADRRARAKRNKGGA